MLLVILLLFARCWQQVKYDIRPRSHRCHQWGFGGGGGKKQSLFVRHFGPSQPRPGPGCSCLLMSSPSHCISQADTTPPTPQNMSLVHVPIYAEPAEETTDIHDAGLVLSGLLVLDNGSSRRAVQRRRGAWERSPGAYFCTYCTRAWTAF